MLQKYDDDWVKKIMLFEVEGKRAQGRARMTRSQCRLKREDAKDRERWRRLSCKQGKWP